MSQNPARQERSEGNGRRSETSDLRHRLLRLSRLFGYRRNGDSGLREAFDKIIEEHEDDTQFLVDPAAHTIIDQVVRVGNVRVADVMVPRIDIVAMDVSASFQELVETVARETHSRMPVFRKTLDHPVGMIHIKDILMSMGSTEKKGPFRLTDNIREILYVPASQRALDLLHQMRRSGTHMALVVDEFGGTDGLTTIEDLVELIVGKIADEHDDEDEPEFDRRPNGVIIAGARLPIESFEKEVGSVLTNEDREGDIDTLGGLVFTIAGRVPDRGEVISHEASGFEFKILEGNARHIHRLQITRRPA